MKPKTVILLAVSILTLSGCSQPESVAVRADNLVGFSVPHATSLADAFLVEQKLAWGKPTKVKSHKLNGDVVQYTLYYETPEGEDARLGKRGLMVTRDGQVRRTVRR